ncbi:hypothetical protein AAFN46_02955 [Pseudomonas sp. CAU 1711]|uniref:hypothetical protein n=1 Tax=Pseudomonas sp. CAU 1711 TaxID=3140356 RepID=UPI0032616AEA
MYKPNETDRPREPAGQPQPAEPDFTQPSSDEATRLPLPGELHEPQPPLEREVSEPARAESSHKSPDSPQSPVAEIEETP